MTGIAEYAATRGEHLHRVAFLLTGDRHSAQDLVQATLLKLLPRWPRVVAGGSPDAYVRRTMLTTYLSWRRRAAFFERPTAALPELPHPAADHDLRLVLLAALAQLPRRQRATVVLRYFEDLSEVATATALGCSIGTVKSQTSRALRSLRALLGEIEVEALS